MTRYDPFAYGEVRLEPRQPGTEDEAEDLLFASGDSQRNVQPSDSSWSLLQEDVDSLLPGAPPRAASPRPAEANVDFAADILGESGPAHAEPTPRQRPAVAARNVEPAEAGAARAPAGALPSADGRRVVRRQPLNTMRPPAAEPEAPAKPQKRSPAVPQRRHLAVTGAVLPTLVCAGGGGAAIWLWMTQQNPVMAGIVAAATLVGAVFAWLLLRG